MSIQAVSPVSYSTKALSFQGKKQDESENENVKTTGGAGKAVASFIVPGLGQLLDGRKKAAAGIFASYLALIAVNKVNLKEIDLKAMKFQPVYKCPAIAYATAALGVAHLIYRTYDAYKGARNENADTFVKAEKTEEKAQKSE